MDSKLREAALTATGFMPEIEGDYLYSQAVTSPADGPLLEVGGYCGKSAIYLGAAARARGVTVFSVDHHHGSEENQAGWEHHDPDLVDAVTGRLDTLPRFRSTIAAAGLDAEVIAVVGDSATVARWWRMPLAVLFIDGGHGSAPAHADYAAWTPQVAPGGRLLIHDVFVDPADGGRPPYEIYLRALADGFTEVGHVGSLRCLQRPADDAGPSPAPPRPPVHPRDV